MIPRHILLLLATLTVAYAAKEVFDSSFAEALARLCQISPRHSLCNRVQILDHIPLDAEPMVRRTKTTEKPPVTPERSFFRSVEEEDVAVDREQKPEQVPEFNKGRKYVHGPSSHQLPSTYGRYQREPPTSPPVHATTPSIWEWMNEAAEQEGYLFEDDQEKRNEIFKNRWLKALRARKARRKVHAVRTETREKISSQLSANDALALLSALEMPYEQPLSPNLLINRSGRSRRAAELTADNNWSFPVIDRQAQPLGKPRQGVSPFRSRIIDDPTRQGSLSSIGDVANIGFGFGIAVPDNDPVSVQTGIGVGLGRSGLAGGLPPYQNVFSPQGERVSMNDYDGDKRNIVPGRWAKYQQALQEGRITPPPILRPGNSLVNVNSGLGIGG